MLDQEWGLGNLGSPFDVIVNEGPHKCLSLDTFILHSLGLPVNVNIHCHALPETRRSGLLGAEGEGEQRFPFQDQPLPLCGLGSGGLM